MLNAFVLLPFVLCAASPQSSLRQQTARRRRVAALFGWVRGGRRMPGACIRPQPPSGILLPKLPPGAAVPPSIAVRRCPTPSCAVPCRPTLSHAIPRQVAVPLCAFIRLWVKLETKTLAAANFSKIGPPTTR